MVAIIRKHVFNRDYHPWRRKADPEYVPIFKKGDTVVNFGHGGSSGQSNHFISLEEAPSKMKRTFKAYGVTEYEPDVLLKRLLKDEITEIRIYEYDSIVKIKEAVDET